MAAVIPSLLLPAVGHTIGEEEGEAPAGQSPRASRYQRSYRVTDVIRLFIVWIGA